MAEHPESWTPRFVTDPLPIGHWAASLCLSPIRTPDHAGARSRLGPSMSVIRRVLSDWLRCTHRTPAVALPTRHRRKQHYSNRRASPRAQPRNCTLPARSRPVVSVSATKREPSPLISMTRLMIWSPTAAPLAS